MCDAGSPVANMRSGRVASDGAHPGLGDGLRRPGPGDYPAGEEERALRVTMADDAIAMRGQIEHVYVGDSVRPGALRPGGDAGAGVGRAPRARPERPARRAR